MPRRLKVFRAHLGFYDSIVAAPSQKAAAEAWGARGVIVSGGVAANSELRRRFTEEAARRGMRVEFPALAMATDNAAMIAAAAWGKFAAGEFAGDEMRASPGLRLG